jgi:hypothetical protein
VEAFAEEVNRDVEEVNPEQLLNWIQKVCKNCLFNSSEGLCANAMDITNKNTSNKLQLIKEHHGISGAGHPRRAKTLQLLKRKHRFQGMRADVDRYVRNCHESKSGKATHQMTHRWLKPLEVPQQPWKDLSMDLVVGRPESEGYNAIWVVVDRLLKMKHLVRFQDYTDGKKLGEVFIWEVFKLHGLPDNSIGQSPTVHL